VNVLTQEQLAIFLACSHEVRNPPQSKLDLIEFFNAKRDSVKVGYRLRAARLLKLWQMEAPAAPQSNTRKKA
jgi:hypothetical protein